MCTQGERLQIRKPPMRLFDVWSDHLKSFGLEIYGYDLPTGKRGNIPDSKTYKRIKF
jgi:penicillin-binding protein 2